jgi:hypothetical protein
MMSVEDALARLLAKRRFGEGVDMGGRHNPTPGEVIAARYFVRDHWPPTDFYKKAYEKKVKQLELIHDWATGTAATLPDIKDPAVRKELGFSAELSVITAIGLLKQIAECTEPDWEPPVYPKVEKEPS